MKDSLNRIYEVPPKERPSLFVLSWQNLFVGSCAEIERIRKANIIKDLIQGLKVEMRECQLWQLASRQKKLLVDD
jgi:hypothetical protein